MSSPLETKLFQNLWLITCIILDVYFSYDKFLDFLSIQEMFSIGPGSCVSIGP